MSKRGRFLGGHSIEKGPTNFTTVRKNRRDEWFNGTDAETDENKRWKKAIERMNEEDRLRRKKTKAEK